MQHVVNHIARYCMLQVSFTENLQIRSELNYVKVLNATCGPKCYIRAYYGTDIVFDLSNQVISPILLT